MTRLAIRGFIGGLKKFEERVEVSAGDEMERLAERHALRLLGMRGGDKHMIEIEFLDEPDELDRFFRIGTDPTMMVLPIGINLDAAN